MHKASQIIKVMVVVAILYVLLLISQPILNSTTQSANASMTAGQIASYPETQAFLEGFPLYIWFVPGAFGVVATVIILKRDNK